MHNSYHNKDHSDKIATDRICLFLMRPQPSKKPARQTLWI